tara:strand:- start:89 stop:412 length:324 start_codon:yes stop_codon:yes gene_type:complete
MSADYNPTISAGANHKIIYFIFSQVKTNHIGSQRDKPMSFVFDFFLHVDRMGLVESSSVNTLRYQRRRFDQRLTRRLGFGAGFSAQIAQKYAAKKERDDPETYQGPH